MLSKLRHALDVKTLRWVYCAIFESHLCYALLVWVQTLIRLKCFTYYRKNPSEFSSFKAEFPIQVLYLKCPKFLNPLIGHSLKTAFLSANLEKAYCLLSSRTGSNFLLSHTLMILDGQILVILKYPLTILKPMVDIQCLWAQYMFGIIYIVAIKMIYFISWELINWKRC